MKTSLEHLPEQKREELRRLAQTIREMCDDVEMIVLYGSYARGDYIKGSSAEFVGEEVG